LPVVVLDFHLANFKRAYAAQPQSLRTKSAALPARRLASQHSVTVGLWILPHVNAAAVSRNLVS